MVLQVQPAIESDVDRLMEILFTAFVDDPYFKAVYPGDNTPSVRASTGKRFLKEWKEDPTLTIVKCTDMDTGVILGFAEWEIYKKERTEEERKSNTDVTWHEGRQKEICLNFLGATNATREKLWGGMPHTLCTLLCVHGDHQGRGAGTLLTLWGVDEAKKYGIPACLEASNAGLSLYLKLGFREKGTVLVKAEDWDGDRDKTYPAMLKMPEST